MAVQQRAFPEIEGPDFVKSDEVGAVGQEVVEAHGHIGGVGRIHPIAEAIRDGELKILWLLNTKPFNDQSEDDQETEIAGRCVKAPGLWRDFTGYDFAIWAREHFWKEFDQDLRRALVLHELLHIEVKRDNDGNPKFATRKHDVEDFVDVARQYGPAALAGDGARYVRAAALFAGEPEPAIGRRRPAMATASAPVDDEPVNEAEARHERLLHDLPASEPLTCKGSNHVPGHSQDCPAFDPLDDLPS